MCLETDYAVDDMRAGFFQAARPLNVARFIKTRAQLDNRGDLFSRISRVDQRLHNRRISACAVQRDFDGEHLRILCRRLDQLDDFIETVVRMMQQHVLSSQHFEKIRMRRQRRIARRLKRTVLQLGKGVIRHQRRKMRHRQRAIELVSVRFVRLKNSSSSSRKSFGQSASTSSRTALPRLERRSSCSIVRKRFSASSSSM